ncbi:hypothetical protein Clacol_006056 [Clathrus columnatus]|uniref:Uncharacterized protein n=1 Tax=Clathrus columnatus TaxID=1419009 RepID=A0AAV5AGK6_9AGAM|nr:hypothetical protein Clacol_006056 [Clathrus columnatus]
MDGSLSSEDDIYDEDRSGSTKLRFPAHGVLTSASETFWSQIISPTLERRMNKNVYKDGKRCLIENTLDDGSLHYVHCLSRRLGPQRAMGAKFKASWEDYTWLLLPEDHILDRYYKAAKKRKEFPDIGEGPYKYRFVVHPGMKNLPIHRQTVFPDVETESLKAEHFAFFSFPFKNLGTLTSHVHPKYVICHIGARSILLTNLLIMKYTLADPDSLDPLIKCMNIVSKWNPHKEDIASKHPGFLKNQIDSNDVISETSDRTANCRLQPYMCDRRLIEEWGYVYVKEEDGVKLKYKEDAPHLLTARKLRLFEEQMFVHETAKTRWKAIELWKSTVSGDPEEQGQIDDYDSFDDARS